MIKKLFIILLVLSILSLMMGSYFILPTKFIDQSDIIINFRLVRVMSAIMVGSMLAIASLASQFLFNNVLASSDFMGLSSLNSLIVLALAFFGIKIGFYGLLIISIILSFVFLISLMKLAKRLVGFTSFIILSLFMAMFITGLISLLLVFSSATMVQDYIYYTLGSLKNARYSLLVISLPVWLLSFWFLYVSSAKFALLSYGESSAKSMGLNVDNFKKQILLVIAVLVVFSVMLVGPMAFVGLLSSHVARLFFKNNSSSMMIITSLVGSITLLIADTLGRSLFSGIEIEAGVITLLLASLYFIISLIRGNKNLC